MLAVLAKAIIQVKKKYWREVTGKKVKKPSLFVDDMVWKKVIGWKLSINNRKIHQDKLIQKSIYFMCTTNSQLEDIMEEKTPYVIPTKIKYPE